MLGAGAASFHEFVDLAGAIAWPIAVAVTVVLLREPIAKALGRTTKITAFQVSLELAAVPEFQTANDAGSPFALRQPAAGREFPSGAPALFDQISDPSTAEYVVIDLGSGDRWLTSRVFIFSVLLERMRGLQCVVFLETVPSGRRRFVGLATPGHVRWSFAGRYAWLEAAFARAYADNAFPAPAANSPAVGQPSPPAPVSPPNGALPAVLANNVAAQFLNLVQAPVPGGDPDEWVELGENQWEHAKWLDGSRVERVMDMLLERNWIERRPDKPADDQIAPIVAQSGRFVAVCEPDGRFRSLIDRDALVQEVAKRA